MTIRLAMLRADARIADAGARHTFLASLGDAPPPGSLLLATCHRVELTAEPDRIDALQATPATAVMERLDGDAVARHLVRVAVGLESVVLGEDQVLHQLRTSVAEARGRGSLPQPLDHLVDRALRAGRQARSWLPADRPSLADVALHRVPLPRPEVAAPVLVVGAGSMGSLAARAVRARGLPLFVASRSQDRAQRLAETCQGEVLGFDPGPGVAIASGVIVALSGPWTLDAETADAIARHVPWVVDLSSPPAVDRALIARLGPRFVSIDDLVEQPDALPTGSRARLEALVDATLADVHAWIAASADRDAARELARLADEVRDEELQQLFATLPGLAGSDRAAVEAMAARLAAHLLRQPFDRLAHDHDGRYRVAVRELFRL